MARRYYKLPPLTALAAFESAARWLSFKDAAEELSVTPGAVSHQIKALEDELGAALFMRKHRGVQLTPDGKDLRDALTASFEKMSRTVARIQSRHTGDAVTVGSTSAVVSLWLSPSVIRFWREYPDIEVHQIIQDTRALSAPEIDIFINYGKPVQANLDLTELFCDELVPVATPDIADRLGACGLADLAQERLIYLEAENRNWTSWKDWFAHLGYDGPIARGVRVNNYAVALQAAQEGVGIALGWRRLISPILNAGHLVPIDKHMLPAPHRFYLCSAAGNVLSPSAHRLKDWLLQDLKVN